MVTTSYSQLESQFNAAALELPDSTGLKAMTEAFDELVERYTALLRGEETVDEIISAAAEAQLLAEGAFFRGDPTAIVSAG